MEKTRPLEFSSAPSFIRRGLLAPVLFLLSFELVVLLLVLGSRPWEYEAFYTWLLKLVLLSYSPWVLSTFWRRRSTFLREFSRAMPEFHRRFVENYRRTYRVVGAFKWAAQVLVLGGFVGLFLLFHYGGEFGGATFVTRRAGGAPLVLPATGWLRVHWFLGTGLTAFASFLNVYLLAFSPCFFSELARLREHLVVVDGADPRHPLYGSSSVRRNLVRGDCEEVGLGALPREVDA
ncbi:MAG: hypothetical protein Kow0069_18020 [Promethearchaeota archaeon]